MKPLLILLLAVSANAGETILTEKRLPNPAAISITGNAATATTVPQSGVNLSTVTAALADKISGTGVRYSTDTVSVSLIDLSTVTARFVADEATISTAAYKQTANVFTGNNHFTVDSTTITTLCIGGECKTRWPSENILKEFFLTIDTADVSGYSFMYSTPSFSGISTRTWTVGTTEILSSSYTTIPGYPNMSFIEAGAWEVHYTASIGNAAKTVNVRTEVYFRNLAGEERLFFTFPTTTINSTVPQDYEAYSLQLATTILTTDRIVAKRYIVGSQAGATISRYFGNGYYNDIDMPAIAASQVNFVPYVGATAQLNTGSFGIKMSSDVVANAYYGSGANLTGVIPSSATGNYLMRVATATYLATSPGACGAGQFISGLTADGTKTCGSPAGGGDVVLAATQTFTGGNTFTQSSTFTARVDFTEATSTITFSGWGDFGFITVSQVAATYYARAACAIGYRAISCGVVCTGPFAKLFISQETTSVNNNVGTPTNTTGIAGSCSLATDTATGCTVYAYCARFK